MKLNETPRGFLRGEFVDYSGSQCPTQESSVMRDDDKDGFQCLWLGVYKDVKGKESTRMHLTENMIREIIPLLECFLKNRTLSESTKQLPFQSTEAAVELRDGIINIMFMATVEGSKFKKKILDYIYDWMRKYWILQ